MDPFFAKRPDFFAWYATQGKFIPARFQREIGYTIATHIIRGNARIIINAPPRVGKSTMTAFWTPLWFLNLWPEKQVVCASYGAALAKEFGRNLRNELASNPDCGVELSDDSTSALTWHTKQGGGMRGSGVSGPIMGMGFHLGIISDPVKDWAEAHSPVEQEALWQWFSGTFLNRAEPGASIIIDSTRWSVHDLCAKVLAHDPERWTVLRFPALAEAEDPLGRKPGEALFPERYPAESYVEFQSYPGKWNALWQQRPDNYGIGRLYSHFDAANVDGNAAFRDGLPLAACFDFNIDPGMHCVLGQYDNERDKFTFFDEIHGPRMDVRSCCRSLVIKARTLSRTGRFPEIHVFGDASGKSEWAGTAESCYDLVHIELAGIQHHIRVPASNPPIRERLDTVNEALRDKNNVHHVAVHPRCVRLLADFEHLLADEHGLIDKREHALSHASDGIGYCVHYLRPLTRAAFSQKPGRWAIGARVSAPRFFS